MLARSDSCGRGMVSSELAKDVFRAHAGHARSFVATGWILRLRGGKGPETGWDRPGESIAPAPGIISGPQKFVGPGRGVLRRDMMSQCSTTRTLCCSSPRKSPFSTPSSNDVCSAPSSSAAIPAPDLSLARHTLSLGYAIRWTSASSSFGTCSQKWTLITCRVPLLPAITIYDNGKRNVPRSGNSKNTYLPLCLCIHIISFI